MRDMSACDICGKPAFDSDRDGLMLCGPCWLVAVERRR